MGYTRIIQYGDITEIWEYEKDINHHRKKYVSPLSKKRAKAIREAKQKAGQHERSQRSIVRSKRNFYRLCHHNNLNAKTIHFLTLTFSYDLTFKEANRHVRRFMEAVKKRFPEIPLSYISVPELTKKGRYHYHLLVYNLPPETPSIERKTRNFQRLFERGYVDISFAEYTSSGIAGYMAKYMAKAITDHKNEATRGYTTSRNIDKISSQGGNTLSKYIPLMFIPTSPNIQTSKYEVPYLGTCHYKKITK